MQSLFLIFTIVIGIMALYFSLKNNVHMLYFFMFMVLFQNIIVILFCDDISPTLNTIFSAIKELMLYAALVFCVVGKKKLIISKENKKELIAIFIYILFLSKNLLITPASMNSAVLSLRYMLVPILCIYVGRNLKISKKKVYRLFTYLIAVSVFLSLFGLLEMFLLGDGFWSKIGYSLYAVKMKGNQAWSLMNGVTVNFYTWDFFGIPIRRLVSITADPLATAFLIYLGAMILITKVVPVKTKHGRAKADLLILVLLIVASILSLSKAIFVFIAVTILACAYYFKWLPKSLLKVGTVVVSLAVILLLKSYVDNTTTITSSINHLVGLQNGFANSGMLGKGLGTAGASVIMLTGAESSVTESYIGALVYQVGIIGFADFVYFMYIQIKKMLFMYRKYRANMIVLSLVLIFGLCICMLLSDSAVSIMGTGIYFIIIGITQQEKLYLEGKKETIL